MEAVVDIVISFHNSGKILVKSLLNIFAIFLTTICSVV